MSDSRDHLLHDAYATVPGVAAMGSMSLLAVTPVSLPVLMIGRTPWPVRN